ncbi:hypothetical protein ABPG75_003306 [Micractinium tetrahymenae]
MSSCSTTGPQAAPPPAPPPVRVPAPGPMECDGEATPPTPTSPSSAAAAAADAGGQHHLLRHVLSPEQCSDALHHFGTADSKAAARMVNRMSQRELRDMFAKVYNVHTNSNNNTWLRRKLLEAVGASRRFYAAANRTGRPKPRRTPADGGASGAAAAVAAKPRAPKAAHAATHSAQHSAQRGTAQHHRAVAPGPALPAGSPRALAARRRAATAGSATGLADAAHGVHAPPPPRHHYLLGSCSRFAPSQQSSEAGETCSEGSEAHPRALAPHAPLATSPSSCGGTPTSAFAAAQPLPYHSLYAPPQPAAIPSNGSHSSLQSSQFAAPALAPRPPSLGLAPGLAGAPTAVAADGKLPHVGSFSTLTALLGGYAPGYPPAYAPAPAAEPLVAPAGAAQQGAAGAALQQPLAPLQHGLGSDLGMNLWVPTDGDLCSLAPAPTLGKPGLDDDWLSWDDDWQLPALF